VGLLGWNGVSKDRSACVQNALFTSTCLGSDAELEEAGRPALLIGEHIVIERDHEPRSAPLRGKDDLFDRQRHAVHRRDRRRRLVEMRLRVRPGLLELVEHFADHMRIGFGEAPIGEIVAVGFDDPFGCRQHPYARVLCLHGVVRIPDRPGVDLPAGKRCRGIGRRQVERVDVVDPEPAFSSALTMKLCADEPRL